MKRKITVPYFMICTLLVVLSLCATLPFILVFITSISSETSIIQNGYSFFPTELSMDAYKVILRNEGFYRSYLLTILVTALGTFLAVVITYCAAYTLNNKNVKYRYFLSLVFYITMLFNGGLVPTYIIMKKLELYNTIWALIIPGMLFSPYNMFLVRNFMKSVPDALMEAARIDGAKEFHVAFQVYLPLCRPVLATVGLFYGINYWNNWFNAAMYIDSEKLYPLQYLLFKIQSQVTMLTQMTSGMIQSASLPQESFKMAVAIVVTGPIILCYPFLQKYFVKGMTVGSVKE